MRGISGTSTDNMLSLVWIKELAGHPFIYSQKRQQLISHCNITTNKYDEWNFHEW
jgi:hypothetical protein